MLCCAVLRYGGDGLGWPVCCTGMGGVGVLLCLCVQVAVKIVKRAGLPEDDEKALKDEVTMNKSGQPVDD